MKPIIPAIITILTLITTTTANFSFFDEKLKPGSSLSDNEAPEQWLLKAAKDWMKKLPNSTPLQALSIPGTHDTGALFGGLVCATQTWSIIEQLEAGIRYLDIRNRRAGELFAIHHGICFQKLFFGGVLEQVEAFLKGHPGEMLIMRVKEEHTPQEGSKSFQEIWDGYMRRYSDLFIKERSSLPKLGEARGKILVLRNANFRGVGVKYDDSKIMQIQDWYKVYLTPNSHPFGSDTASLSQKKSFLREYLMKSREKKKLILNHWSCTNGMLPKTCARATNADGMKAIGPYKKAKTTGIVIMDFPGDRLIYRIIKTNFKSTKRCGSRVWRASSDKTFAEIRMPSAHVGTMHMVEQGAYYRFVFPKCHRATWSDLRLHCGVGGWSLHGELDADGLCSTYNTDQKFVKVGHRSDDVIVNNAGASAVEATPV